MRTPLKKALFLSSALALVACAELLNELERSTDPDTVIGKAVRGVNRLRKSFQELDPSEEHYIGRAVAAEVLAIPAYKVLPDRAKNEYVNQVGQGLVIACDEIRHTFNGYTFAVLDSGEINAFATPGGVIFVTRGLLELTRSEDELACVLAHEIAHVSHRDGLAAIKKGNLIAAFRYLGESAAQATLDPEEMQQVTDIFGTSIQDIITTLVRNGYSRDAEYAADRSGAAFAAAAGYDSGGLNRVLARMGAQGGSGGMFATHPSASDRLANLGPAPPYAGDPAGVAARTARFKRCLEF